ncbi:MAG: hypothetical protein J5704_03720, partial [Paludibacteraceae bacterium]|nr:hypothetical protein [Paludibacteraceae bacterium]
MGLKLNIVVDSSNTLTMSFCDTPETTATYDGSTMTLVDITFNKQMYQPGEINARIQFTKKTKLANVSGLLNKQVSLTCDGNTVASNYYVHEIIPEISKTEMSQGEQVTRLYVNFKIYSLDKLLTLDHRSRAWAALRLAEDILKTEAGTIAIPYTTNAYLSSQLVINPKNHLYFPVYKKKDDYTYDTDANGKQLVTNDGCLHPYLVQYDESFYDMLIRTANRWGEFVYFERGNLVFGRDDAASTTPDIKSGYTVVYAPTKQYDYRDIVSNDEYLEYIKKDDYIYHVGDLFSTLPDDRYGNKVVQSLLNMKGNVFDWVADNGVDALWTASQNDVYIKKLRKQYNDTYFPESFGTITDAEKQRVLSQYAKIKLIDQETADKDKDSYNTAVTELETAETAAATAEEAVNEKAPFPKTYKDYLDSNGDVTIPTGISAELNTALNDLKSKYAVVTTKKTNLDKYRKEVMVYSLFSALDLDNKDRNTNHLSSAAYATVLKNELAAGSSTVCVDLDANYRHLCLGDIFTIGSDKYIVTRVECKVDEKDTLVTTMETKQDITYVKKAELKHTKNLHFYVYGIKQISANVFYPPMLPTGHARIVSPQLAVVQETFDPKHNARYRVSFPWQKESVYSPWIPVSHEMMSKNSGSVWQLEKKTYVMVNFKDGNVERPYIEGAVQTEKDQAARSTLFNNMDLSSPAGHAIRLTDGYGAGAANFIANFNPLVSWCKGWCPDGSAWHNESGSWQDYKYYEGGVEITDRYGIYSIKGSTDERKISIKSPYGDVTLSAFTGITISAPNGDVKIAGKNVSIEAGNNLSIVSGKNIVNGLFGSGALIGRSGSKKATVADLGKAFGSKAVSAIDISLIRDVVEAFIRPIAGEMKIQSNRLMTIQAGVDATEFQETSENEDYKATKNWWKKTVTDEWDSVVSLRSSDTWQSTENGQIIVKCASYSGATDAANQ